MGHGFFPCFYPFLGLNDYGIFLVPNPALGTADVYFLSAQRRFFPFAVKPSPGRSRWQIALPEACA